MILFITQDYDSGGDFGGIFCDIEFFVCYYNIYATNSIYVYMIIVMYIFNYLLFYIISIIDDMYAI